MATALFVGAGVGAVAGELLKAILAVKHKISNCKEEIEQLEMTLKNIIPLFHEGQRLEEHVMQHLGPDRVRPNPDLMIQRLEEGTVLVRKSATIRPWSYRKKHNFATKVRNLNSFLDGYCQREITVEIFRDNKQLLGNVMKIIGNLDAVTFGWAGAVPGLGESTVETVVTDGVSARDDDGRTSTSDVPQLPCPSVGNGYASVVSQLSTLTIGNSYASLVPPLPALTVGMAVPLNELKTKLFQDGVNVTGLCAPGGGGKTTLAAALCMDGEVKEKFKGKIYFMTVSRSPDVKVIIQELFKDIKGLPCMPEFQNDEDGLKRLGYLLKRMEPQPILVVLDDVWSKDIIQKFKFGTTGYKLLITTRNHFECFDYTYHLNMLGKKDAHILFRSLAFPEDGDYEEPDETQVNEMVKGCKGFPMLLKVIGNSLRQQPQWKWQHVPTMLSGGSSILRAHRELLDCLSPSLDSMEPQLQECFLDLGSFPKGNRIPAAALIDMWIELYDLDENVAYGILLELSLRNLVNLIRSGRKDAGDPYGDFNELFVTQHVLFRDLALYRNQEINIRQNKRLIMDRREEALPKIWKEHKNQLFEAQVVSIDTGEMDTSSWFEMGFPNAKVLILNFSGKNYCLPPFLKQMEQLKVLIITNNGLKHAKLSGFPPVVCLRNLRRIRLEMISIPSLNDIKDPLESLQKLSLVLCEVGEGMRNCTVDYSVIFPNLSEIDIGYCIDLSALPLGFWKLDLHKLIISHCFKLNQLSENIDQMKEIETLTLRACFELKELPDQICSLETLQFLDISESFRIGKIPEDLSKLRSLRKLDMRKCEGLTQIPKSAMELKNLKEAVCDEERATLWEPVRHHLPRLRIKVREETDLGWLGIYRP